MTQFLNHSIDAVLRNNTPSPNPKCHIQNYTQPPQTTFIESPVSSPSLSEDENMPRPAHQTSRRGRTAFSRDQVAKLEREFAKENYISKSRRLELAAKIKLPESTIKIWFQNRRMKYKHQRIEKMWPFSGYFMPPMMMMDPLAMQQTFLMASSAAATSSPATPNHMMFPFNYPPVCPPGSTPSAMSLNSLLPTGQYPPLSSPAAAAAAAAYSLNSAVYDSRSGCSPLNICC